MVACVLAGLVLNGAVGVAFLKEANSEWPSGSERSVLSLGGIEANREAIQPIEPPRVKPPIIPPKHPKPPEGDKPVDVTTPKAPTPDPSAPGESVLPFPHPLITEVLYAVPTGEKGDANRDGSRHAAGDEFVELVNPHSKPIQLKGYTITDRNPPGKGQLKFTFPALELPPGGVVVVFNGCEQGWGKGEAGEVLVGDSRAAKKPNPSFFGAYVFTIKNTAERTSWSNSGDYALLSDPAGNPVHCVHWGDFSEPIPSATLTEKVPTTSKASVQRINFAQAFTAHTDLESPEPPTVSSPDEEDGSSDPTARLERGRVCSPGWFPGLLSSAGSSDGDKKAFPGSRDKR